MGLYNRPDVPGFVHDGIDRAYESLTDAADSLALAGARLPRLVEKDQTAPVDDALAAILAAMGAMMRVTSADDSDIFERCETCHESRWTGFDPDAY